MIRYGAFYELVMPVGGGHLSVGIEPSADPIAVESVVRKVAAHLMPRA